MSYNTFLVISLIFLFFLIIVLAFVIVMFFVLVITKVPYVKTPKKILNIILNEINLKPDNVVCELGCGNARFLIKVEKKFGAETIGYELSPWPYFLARLNIFINKSKTKIFNKNFYKENLAYADVIFCFLISNVMPKVQAQLEKQLKKGAQVISFAFPIHAWQPTKVISPNPENKKASKIYFYQR